MRFWQAFFTAMLAGQMARNAMLDVGLVERLLDFVLLSIIYGLGWHVFKMIWKENGA